MTLFDTMPDVDPGQAGGVTRLRNRHAEQRWLPS